MTKSIDSVKELKQSLSKELIKDGGGNSDRCLDILKRLDESFIDIDVLSKTMVGAVVSKFKTNDDEKVATAAKVLVRKWKKIAKTSGTKKKPMQKEACTAASATTTKQKISAAPIEKKGSVDSSSADAQDSTPEWDHLTPYRRNIAKKFQQIFKNSEASLTKSGVDPTALSSLFTSRATEVEDAINTQSKGEKTAYSRKLRSLIFNLKKNSNLCENVILGTMSAKALVVMGPDELATSEISKERANIISKMSDSRRLDWEDANEDKINEMCGIKGDLLNASLFTCGRCKSTKTTSTQKQTRSADEPMTVFVLCKSCGNRWKC